MTSRATGPRPAPRVTFEQRLAASIPGRDFPDIDRYGHRKAVCRRCKLILNDAEPMSPSGEFWHIAQPHQTRALACANNGQCFDVRDKEIEPFLRKGRRRALKRMGVRS